MKTIELTQGFVAIIDDEDYDALINIGPWQVSISKSNIYAQTWRKPRLMHKFILPAAKLIDHIDNNGLNNRRCNLREATTSQNMLNPNNVLNINNTSGRRGVFFDTHAQRWIAAVRINGKQKKLGTFELWEDACAARDLFDRSIA